MDDGLLPARQADPLDARLRQGFGAFSPFALFSALEEGKFDGLIMRNMKTVIKVTSLTQK